VTLFEALGWALARSPLLPVEAYPRAWVTPSGDTPVLSDPRVRAALAVGSPDLFAALSDRLASNRGAARAQSRARRYVVRMATRPTPYGLFAGVGLASWGESTDLRIGDDRPRTRTRLDMEWLSGFVADLEAQTAIRRGMRMVASPALLIRGGRVFVGQAGPDAGAAVPERASVRATPIVREVVTMTRTPVGHDELVDAILDKTGATHETAERLLTQLWEYGVLLTELRPPLTCASPARFVRDRLASMPAAREPARRLDLLLATVDKCDTVDLEHLPSTLSSLVGDMDAVREAPLSSSAVQVDTALGLTGRSVHRAVAAEAAVAAELLLQMSPYPTGLPHLDAYRQAFERRYGEGRPVPLLELLDPQFGLGPPDTSDMNEASAAVDAAPDRNRTLEELALQGLRNGRRVVELDDDTLDRLRTWTPSAEGAPVSLDLAVLVAAPSAARLDAGEFQVIVGPNVGAHGAGRNTGRFADLLGDEAIDALRRTAAVEAERAGGPLWTELVYAPGRSRLANVAIRPVTRNREIALGTMPGVGWDGVVPLDELVVTVRDGRLRVSWPAAGAELAVTQGHMLSTSQAPPVAQFLLDLGGGDGAQLAPFTWGPAAGFPFLPRVQRGRVVLSLARWRLGFRILGLPGATAGEEVFAEALAGWRAGWDVSRYVYLAVADNRLLLDLDEPECGAIVHEELRRLTAGRSVVLQEALPGLEDAWLPGPDGHHLVELVVPLVRVPGRHVGPADGAVAPRAADSVVSPVSAISSVSAVSAALAISSARVRPPGSDWLYLKLYCPPVLHDELIADPLRVFTGFAMSAGLARAWFFIRYLDPEPHLRIRFHGESDVLLGSLLPQLTRWGGELVSDGAAQRFSFETYERELERYGGERGMGLAERLFAADSVASAELLWLARSEPPTDDRLALAMVSIDDLLAGLGLSEAERLGWYEGVAPLSREDGLVYRSRQAEFRRLLGGPVGSVSERLSGILATRRQALAHVSAQLPVVAKEGDLTQPPTTLYRSYVHMHCNRLFDLDSADESRALALLRRTRDSLRHSAV
jgi:lantibiotic biosynthesis protein